MKLPEMFTNRKAREDFKDKMEVAMAVIVLTSFAYTKYKNRKDSHIDITSFGQEQS